MKKMLATVLEVNPDGLLVLDSATSQEVIVHTNCTCHFQVNDRVMILFNGIMTMSLPPQINALRISRLPSHNCC